MTCRDWLLQNKYEDVVELIDEAIRRIEAKGKKSRRNWWDTLAGGPGGRRLSREGVVFPVLRVGQIRQGKPVTDNAIWRRENEEPPDVMATKRWPRRRLPSRSSKIAKRSAAAKQRAS